MNKLSAFEITTICRAAAEKASEIYGYPACMNDICELLENIEDPIKYCEGLNIAEAYEFFIMYFINKIHQMEVLRK